MKTILRILGALLLIVLIGAAAIYFTGNTRNVIVWLTKPDHGWDPSLKAPDPDYADAASWAALPGKDSFANFVPEGVSEPPGERPVDVFFIHPTGYLRGLEWNSPMDPNSATEENTKWMMANQASAYNGCCNVYAPRYREASIFRYFGAPEDIATKSMDFAYADVVRAFQYFIEHQSNGRPFIIASHSQGTSHAFRLVKEHIDGTPLADRMVAAYLIGADVKAVEVDALKTVKACTSATQTGCIVHWATVGEGVAPEAVRFGQGLLCTNPLSWERGGARAPASLHKGGVPASGQFQMKLWGKDLATGVEFKPLGAPVAQATWAECRDGLLFVADLAGTPFGPLDVGGKNYHGADYPLFHMDIRENAKVRVGAYLARTQAAAR